MQNIYEEVSSLDIRCYEQFALSEDVLMENASLSISNYIIDYSQKQPINQKILIVCGSGNNGADGIAVARELHNNPNIEVSIFMVLSPKSDMAILQTKRAKLLGVEFIDSLEDLEYEPTIVVDAIFGSGLKRALSSSIIEIVDKLNSYSSLKIACDMPTGILSSYKDDNYENSIDGIILDSCFKADITITMGALKSQLYSDNVKKYIGKIIVANLGISRINYETNSNIKLLDESDMKLPFRDSPNTHKGSFGHLLCISGDKDGASRLASLSSLNFGVGLCTIYSADEIRIEPSIMQCNDIKNLPSNINSIIIGMGLGNSIKKDSIKYILDINIPKVIDADMFYDDILLSYLEDDLILTPHPKEFVSLLKMTQIADISIEQLQNNRIKYAQIFSQKYPKVVLLLKGANVIISQDNKLYINPLGNQALSKGGSGDVLSGMIGALLAQRKYHNFELIDCAINASLAHSVASNRYVQEYNNYSLIPDDLIDSLKKL
jgi:hydroxyethylthiazole kinase-like uncharacterized protein yjeF